MKIKDTTKNHLWKLIILYNIYTGYLIQIKIFLKKPVFDVKNIIKLVYNFFLAERANMEAGTH